MHMVWHDRQRFEGVVLCVRDTHKPIPRLRQTPVVYETAAARGDKNQVQIVPIPTAVCRRRNREVHIRDLNCEFLHAGDETWINEPLFSDLLLEIAFHNGACVFPKGPESYFAAKGHGCPRLAKGMLKAALNALRGKDWANERRGFKENLRGVVPDAKVDNAKTVIFPRSLAGVDGRRGRWGKGRLLG